MNNEQINAKGKLTFKRAWFHMLNGKKVKRPSWKGYQVYENNTIMMYTMEGDVIDIRDTQNVAYTFSNIVENDWQVVEDQLMDAVCADSACKYSRGQGYYEVCNGLCN